MYGALKTVPQDHVESTAGLEVDFAVEQVLSGDLERETRANRVSEEGMSVHKLPGDPEFRHVWLRFTIPGTNQVIAALGELLRSEPGERVTEYRFKHLFPRDRKALRRFLDANRHSASWA